MNDARKGIARLHIGGEAVPVTFTYEAIDSLGHERIFALFRTVRRGGIGSVAAVAELVEVGTAGAVTAADWMAARPGIKPAMDALWDGWALAWYGPSKEAAEGDENPPTRPQTLWKRLCGRLFGQG